MQHCLAGHIAERDMLEFHMAFAVPKLLCIRQILRLLRLVQQPEHPLRGGQCTEDFVDDIGDFIDRPGKFPAVEHEAGNLAQAHNALQIQDRTAHADRRQADIRDHADGRPHRHAQSVRVPVSLCRRPVDLGKARGSPVLVGIGQNRPLPGEHLLGIAVHPAVGSAALRIARACLLSHPAGEPDGDRDRKKHAQHQRD